MHQHAPTHPTKANVDNAETWLTGIVNQAALRAIEFSQLTDYLAAQRTVDPADVINTYANTLEERLHQLETANDDVDA